MRACGGAEMQEIERDDGPMIRHIKEKNNAAFKSLIESNQRQNPEMWRKRQEGDRARFE
jgi:hypothetical protein